LSGGAPLDREINGRASPRALCHGLRSASVLQLLHTRMLIFIRRPWEIVMLASWRSSRNIDLSVLLT
jgi:hypothetical protein